MSSGATINVSSDAAVEEDSAAPPGSGLAFAAGFFFSARMISGLVAVRVFGLDARMAAAANIGVDLILLVLAGFHAWGPEERTFRSMFRVSSIRWVLVFLAFSGCSFLWSGTMSPATSIAYWCGMAADVGVVFLLFRTGSVEGVAHSMMKGFIWATCCLALVGWLMPAQADLRLGDPDFFNTNQIGNLCAFAVFLAQYLMRRKDGKWAAAALFLVVTVLRSLSKTTLVAFVISESFLVIQDRSMSRRSKMLLTMGVIVAVVVFWGLFEAYYDIYTASGDQAETLTGRTVIWTYVLSETPGHLWVGHGFDSMWNVIPAFGPDRFEARHAENEVLQQFWAYGAAGVALLVGLYGSLYRKLRNLRQSPLKIIFVSMLLFIVVRGLAEAEPFDLLLPLWAIVMISMLVQHATAVEEKTASLVSLGVKA